MCQFDVFWPWLLIFLVSNIPSEDILLGFDFLSRHGAVVDLGEKKKPSLAPCP